MEIERVHPELRDVVSRLTDLNPERKLMGVAGRIGPRLIRWRKAPGVSIGRDRIGGVRDFRRAAQDWPGRHLSRER